MPLKKNIFSYFKFLAFFALILFVSVITISPQKTFAATNIDATFKNAKLDSDGSNINFGCANCNVQVSNTAITGFAWGENIGWINLNPTGQGVMNDSNGQLTGFAWGDNAGWVNFDTPLSGQQVTIDITNGEFSGYAWAQNYGWIKFSCNTGDGDYPEACVKTSWRPPSGPGSSFTPQCSDGTDNDGDGKTDYGAGINNDPGCSGPSDDNETNAPAQCSDGIDNDSDGLIDFPNDPGCSASFDTNETDVPLTCTPMDETIDPVFKYAQFTIDGSLINFGVATGNVHVTDTALTGYAWSEGYGWINLNPTGEGVINNGNGGLSGYAWGEQTGWINFRPSFGGVYIDSVGDFHGYAWSQIYGWMLFNSADDSSYSGASFKVHSDWIPQSERAGCVANPLPVLVSINPSSVTVGAPATTVTLTGNNFMASSVAQFDGLNRTTTYNSSTQQLTMSLPASDLDVSGTFPITVFNPAPGGGVSNSLPFQVKPKIGGGYDCSDGVDNDSDGLTDYPNDPGCTSASDNDETNVLLTVCSNTLDDDGDTLIDFPNDPGCASVSGTSELDPPTYKACSNGLDDDGDGKKDYPNDPGCTSASDDDETNSLPTACSNGTDDDADGLIDYPNDPGCTSASDTDETNIAIVCTSGSTRTCVRSNNCNETNAGIETCQTDGAWGSCSAIPPADRASCVNVCTPGSTQTCVSSANNCGETNAGTQTCQTNGTWSSTCSATSPSDRNPCVIETPPEPPTTPSEVIDTIIDIFKTPTGNIVTKTTQAVGLVSALVSPLVTGTLGLSSLQLLTIRFWHFLLSLLGLRKKRKPWGTVYDSETKRPLDPAYVVLQDLNGKEISTAITDLNGRYGFLVAPGVYKIIANKTNYQFPSAKLAGKTNDEIYNSLYFGDYLEIKKDGEVITKNIPMDPLNFDWNEFMKNQQHLMTLYSKREKIMNRIFNVLFWAGFIFSVFALFALPSPYNIVVIVLYVLSYILRRIGLIQEKRRGEVIDKETGLPAAFAIVRVFGEALGNEVATRVADIKGRFYMLVGPKQNYSIKIEKKQADGSYAVAPASLPFYAKNGIINGEFKI